MLTKNACRKHPQVLEMISNSKERRIPLSIIFHKGDRRRRDQDNLIASMKASLDGVADALGVDDNLFDIKAEFPDEVHVHAFVIVQIGENMYNPENP